MAGPALSDAQWAAVIEQQVGQPPELALDCVRRHPYARQALIRSGVGTGVDVDLLAALVFTELDVRQFELGAVIDHGMDQRIVELGEAIAALAVAARVSQDRARAKLRELGVASPSFEDLSAATALYRDVVQPGLELVQAIERQGQAAGVGFLAPSWGRCRQDRNAAQRAGRVVATALLFRRSRVFSSAPAPRGAAHEPDAQQPEAEGIIEKLGRLGR